MNFGGTSSSNRDEHSPHSPKYEEEIRDWEEEIREWDGEQASLMHLDSTNNLLIASCIVEDEQSMHKGSIPGHIFINHGREVGRVWLWNAYFSANLPYGEDLFRMMAYGASSNATNEYVRVGESAVVLCMEWICRAIVEIFDKVCLRSPNAMILKDYCRRVKSLVFQAC